MANHFGLWIRRRWFESGRGYKHFCVNQGTISWFTQFFIIIFMELQGFILKQKAFYNTLKPKQIINFFLLPMIIYFLSVFNYLLLKAPNSHNIKFLILIILSLFQIITLIIFFYRVIIDTNVSNILIMISTSLLIIAFITHFSILYHSPYLKSEQNSISYGGDKIDTWNEAFFFSTINFLGYSIEETKILGYFKYIYLLEAISNYILQIFLLALIISRIYENLRKV